MVTNVPLDDDLVKELELRAGQEGVSLTQFLEGVLRRELRGSQQASAPPVQKTYAMGESKVPLVKALALSADFEDEEILHKLKLGK
jgi:hypothetical protein